MKIFNTSYFPPTRAIDVNDYVAMFSIFASINKFKLVVKPFYVQCFLKI